MVIVFALQEYNLKQPNTNSNSTHNTNIILNLGGKNVQASSSMNLHGSVCVRQVKNSFATVNDGGQAAGIRNVVLVGECDIVPVMVLLGPATVQLEKNRIHNWLDVRLI